MVNVLRKLGKFERVAGSKAEYARQIVEEGIKQAGLEKGDIVLVHSDATPAMNMGEFECWEDACNLLKSCILNVIGDTGTFIVPAFNWDFCNGEAYSQSQTVSKCGMFSNNVLFDPRSVRSFHPIYSFAGFGPGLNSLFNNISKSSFGKDSVFERLYKSNATILFFNLNFGLCTFIHYVEQQKGVSYRYLKEFTGLVQKNGKKYTDTFDFYVSHLDKGTTRDGSGYLYITRLGEYLLSKGDINEVILANKYPVLLTDCEKVFNGVIDKLDNDPAYAVDIMK